MCKIKDGYQGHRGNKIPEQQPHQELEFITLDSSLLCHACIFLSRDSLALPRLPLGLHDLPIPFILFRVNTIVSGGLTGHFLSRLRLSRSLSFFSFWVVHFPYLSHGLSLF